MKRSIAYILALFYFVISSGFVLNIHYCHGKISGAKLSFFAEQNCSCGKKVVKKCCKTEAHFVKTADTHQPSDASIAICQPASYLVPNFHFQYNQPFKYATSYVANYCNTSPQLPAQPLYLQHCVFRI